MVITDKQQICKMIMDEVVMKHGAINIDLNDYKECQEKGTEWFALSISGDNFEEVFQQLGAEISAFDPYELKAVIIYGQRFAVTSAEELWGMLLPTDVLCKWGIESFESKNIRLLVFAFR